MAWSKLDRDAARKIAGMVALMVPYAEKGQKVSGKTRDNVFELMLEDGELSAPEMVLGLMRAAEVALVHLSTHVLKNSLNESAEVVAAGLEDEKPRDPLDFGDQAYEDGRVFVSRLAKVLTDKSKDSFKDEFEDDLLRGAFGVLAVLMQLLLQLANGYQQPPSWVAQKLALDIAAK